MGQTLLLLLLLDQTVYSNFDGSEIFPLFGNDFLKLGYLLSDKADLPRVKVRSLLGISFNKKAGSVFYQIHLLALN